MPSCEDSMQDLAQGISLDPPNLAFERQPSACYIPGLFLLMKRITCREIGWSAVILPM